MNNNLLTIGGRWNMQYRTAILALAAVMLTSAAQSQVYNLKVVTDASPDFSDMDGLIHSITSRWQTPEEKIRALFYWNHIARRQTSPMIVHGTALTDPIRQFNDYGFTMCSTISGINCSIWDAMGLKAKYWDISNHTVAEVEYGGRWHMFDNSMSALYTLCDGKTIAGVEDIGAARACPASGGKVEPGHIARYHCLNSTSKNGFLTGADTIRSLDEEYRCFNPNGLKYRSYYYDRDRGHRYILNLREGEVYDRRYTILGTSPSYYVPNNGKDPEDGRFGLRGNGERVWKPALSAEMLPKVTHGLTNIRALPTGGIAAVRGDEPAEAIFKVEGANVIASLQIQAELLSAAAPGDCAIAISTSNGLQWREVWKNDRPNTPAADVHLVGEVSGAYDVLVRFSLRGARAAVSKLRFTTITALNSKTQPQLLLGKNTVYVGAGDQTESIVFWPDLRGDRAKPYIVDQSNVTFEKENPGFQGTLHATKPNEDAYVVFRIDAPGDIRRVNYGGRLYNRAPKAHIDLLHSFDEGKTWTRSYSLTDTAQPWDVLHYETVAAVPPGTRSVLLKYLLNASEAGPAACSIYAVRMEVDHIAPATIGGPVEVTFRWSERAQDRSLVQRSHTQLVNQLPARYAINVGGIDHPIVNSLRINLPGAVPNVRYGYSDGRDVGGERFVPRWITTGKNVAEGRTYTVSTPSETQWEAGDPDGKKLTDGIVGPTYSGGTSYRSGAIWSANKTPVITLDLGAVKRCASFGLNGHGYPAEDALKSEVRDQIEVFLSKDGKEYKSAGFLKTNLLHREIPVNFMLPDNEELTGATFRLIPDEPVEARYVQFKVANRRYFCVTELEVLDSIDLKPFDLRIALPDDPAARK
jgi:hypothetical protein